MKFLALTLAVALATPDSGANDGGLSGPDYLALERAALVVKQDGGEITLYVDGGSWLSDTYVVGYAKELADKRKRIEVLESNAGVPEAQWLLLAASIGAVIGIGATVAVFAVRGSKQP